MEKRYYVEVIGLGGDGEKELIDAGVPQGAILVVGGNNRNQTLIDALQEITGVTFDNIQGRERTRDVVSARILYIHFARLAGDTKDIICRDLNRERYKLKWYLSEFDDRLQGDREFAGWHSRVRELLDKDISWRSREVRTRRDGSQAIGRKKIKKKKKKMIMSVQKMPDRQLTIKFPKQ